MGRKGLLQVALHTARNSPPPSTLGLNMYILDTSAIRGISRDNIITASTHFNIAVSTVSVLELASHLTDSPGSNAYSRARGNLLKCQRVRILDDPFLRLAQRTGLPVNGTRREDAIALRQLLDAVNQAETLVQLERMTFTYADGTPASFSGIGERIGEALRNEEDQYVRHIRSLPGLLGLDPYQNGTHNPTSAELFRQLNTVTESLYTINYGTSIDDMFSATVLYFGYILSRMYQYADRCLPGEVGEVELQVDRNDCEDAYISLNLDLRENDTLVTNDRGTQHALRRTITVLRENGYLPEIRIMSNDEFLSAIMS